jgi:GNAT superfamily N-acetyltransferase
MRIREATTLDHRALVGMALRFLKTVSTYEFLRPSRDHISHLVDVVLDAGVILVAEVPDAVVGAIALIATPHPVNGTPFADEVAWWVEPEHRGGLRAGPYLLGAAEDWALRQGCNMVKMVAPLPSTVGRFLEKRGYRAIEVAYVKTFGGGK